MMIGRQNQKITRTSFDDEGVGVAAESVVEAEDVTDVTPGASDALQLEAESVFWMFKVTMRKCRFVKDTSFSEPEDHHELETGSGLHQNVNLGLADPSYNTRGAQSQVRSTHSDF